jgi:hypothetical protein
VHLVQEQHVGVALRGDGEPEARAHALRVGRHRQVEGGPEAAQLAHVLNGLPRRAHRHAAQHREQLGVLAAAQLAEQPRVGREQRADPAVDRHSALVGDHDPAEEPEQRRLAGPGRPDERDALARVDAQIDAAKAPGRQPRAAQAREHRRQRAALTVEQEPDPGTAHVDRGRAHSISMIFAI